MSVAPHEMDAMGGHSEELGTVWLPRSLYPTRDDARQWFIHFAGLHWLEARVLSRWARHAPELPGAEEFDGEYWAECDPDEPGAFRVWRCEGAPVASQQAS